MENVCDCFVPYGIEAQPVSPGRQLCGPGRQPARLTPFAPAVFNRSLLAVREEGAKSADNL